MDEITRFKKNGSIFVVIFFTYLKQILLKFGFFFPLEICTWIFYISRCNFDYM